MGALIALLNLAVLFLTTLLFDGSGRYFQVSIKSGTAPLTVRADATYLLKANRANTFIWNFGNGESLTTTHPIVNYTYSKAGTYSLSLIYQETSVDKKGKVKIKSSNKGGAVKIVVAPKPNLSPVAKLTCSSPAFLKVDCHAEGSLDSDGNLVSYKYSWGDSQDSLLTNSTLTNHTYVTGGAKVIRLTVKDNQGAEGFVETTVNVLENTKPTASFTCTKNGIVSINCQSTSTDPDQELTSFVWTLDDGSTYTTKSFNHTFNKRPQDVGITSHLVTLEVTDDHGIKDVISNSIAVNLEPIRLAPISYIKIFMDQTKVDLRAFITRTQFAIKSAVYTIYDSNNTLLHTIPVTEFYQNHSTKIDLLRYGNYRVDFKVIDYRDQEVSTQRFLALAEDTIKLPPFVGFRAVQSNINTVYINLNPSFDYDENLSIKSFEIDLGNGEKKILTNDTFLTYTYAEPGTYNIKLLAKTNHGTESSSVQAVTITNQSVPVVFPDPTFSYRIYSYAQNVSFYNEKSGSPNGEIIAYVWDFGDGTKGYGETQAHFYSPGSYLVSLTVSDSAGYSSTQTQKITIDNSGDDIVANIDCSLNLPFVDITQSCKINALDKFNEINRIRVVWGDNTAFNLQTPFDPRQGIYYPQKKYEQEGTFPIRLIVNTKRGAFKIHDINLTIKDRRPIANIQCVVNNLMIFCNGLGSFDPKGLPLKYTFDFGDGVIEENLTGSLSHAYQEAGLYQVGLTVEDQLGFKSTHTTMIQAVKPPNLLPIASFTCESPAPNSVYCWDNGSYDPDGVIAIRKITFDDNQFSFVNPPETVFHQFETSGNHSFTYTVIDTDGGETTVTKSFLIKANNPPIASFECNTPSPQRLSCYSTSIDTDSGDMPVKFTWEYGDGNSTTGLASFFDHMYSAHGAVDVKLIVEDKFGMKSELIKRYTTLENMAPIANINCVNTTGATYQCSAIASDSDGYIVSKIWNVEGVSFTGDSILYEFKNGGEKNIKLIVKDELGREAIATNIVIVSLPIAYLNCTLQNGYEVTCSAEFSLSQNAEIADYQINFNNDYISRQKSAKFEFLSSGEKLITLSILDVNGKKAEAQTKITVEKIYKLPEPDFSYFTEVGGKVVFDASHSLIQDKMVKTFAWKIGENDQVISRDKIFETVLQPNQTYLVTLLVIDERGAEKSITKSIHVYDINVHSPDQNNDSSVEGIDSDNDGVRDDVQVIIARLSLSNVQKKKYLTMLAKVYESNLRNTENELIIKKNFKDKIILEQCVELVSGKELADQESSIIDIAYHNTDERFLVQSGLEKFLVGELIEQISENSLASTCEAL